jgi:hypothetical protein
VSKKFRAMKVAYKNMWFKRSKLALVLFALLITVTATRGIIGLYRDFSFLPIIFIHAVVCFFIVHCIDGLFGSFTDGNLLHRQST